MRQPLLAAGAAIALLALGCGEDEAPRSAAACEIDPAGAPLTTEEVLADGPYEVGTTSFTLVDDTRGTPAQGGAPAEPTRTLPTRVWYPASAGGTDAPLASGGPFPLVVYSHGLSSFNTEGSNLASHLASIGYVVFAADFPLSRISAPGEPSVNDIASQPGDVSFLIDSAIAMSGEPAHLLEGSVDAERIAAVGLSLGGLTTLLVAFHPTLHDPRVDVAAAMAPPASFLGELFYDTRVVPLLLLSGDIDAIVAHEPNAEVAFERADPPVGLFTLIGGTHTGFASISLTLEALDNVDQVGCEAISDVIDDPPDAGAAFDLAAALGGAEAGLVPAASSPRCVTPLPRGMRPSRQQEIEVAAISSFLEAYLAADPAVRGRACHYNERVLASGADDLRFERR